ncbi:MAG: hypothetical protein Ta2D_04000 [Rickettsiales bacterium]|nr:MAG: hypothetical protein Ta2D_04000 [Rickettsiales bacterium]
MEKNRKIVFIIIFLLNLHFISPVFSALCSVSGSIAGECDLSIDLALSGDLSLDSGGKINVGNKINIFANPNTFFLNAGTLNFLSSGLTTTSGQQSINIDAILDLSNINSVLFNGDFNNLSATYYLIKATSFTGVSTFSDKLISNTSIASNVNERKYLQLSVNSNILQANYLVDITIGSVGKYVVPTTATQISNLIINNNATLSILGTSGVLTIDSNIVPPASQFKIEFDFNGNINAFDTAKTINFAYTLNFGLSVFSFENFTASNYSTNKQFNLLNISGGGSFTGLSVANNIINETGATINNIYKKNYIELSVINTDKSLIGTLKYDVVVNNGGDYAVNTEILTKLTANNGGALTFQENDVLQLVSIDLQNNSIINFDFTGVVANDTIGKITGITSLTLTNITLKSISLNTSSYAVGNTFTLLQLNSGTFIIGAGQKAEISTTIASNIENKYYLDLTINTNNLIGTYRHDLTINDDGDYVFNKIEGFSNIIVGDVETASGENATLTIAKHTTNITKLTTNTLLFNTGSFLNFDLTGIVATNTLAQYNFNNAVSLANAEITLSGTLGFFQIGDEVIFFEKSGGTGALTNLATNKALITTLQPISNVVLSQGFDLSIDSSDNLVGSFFKDMTINADGSVLFGSSVATNQGFFNHTDFRFNSITINDNGKFIIEDGIAPSTNSITPIIIEDIFNIKGESGNLFDNFNTGKNNKIEINGNGIFMFNWANVVLGEGSILNTTGFSLKTGAFFFMDKNSTLNISIASISNTDIDNTSIMRFSEGSKINFTYPTGITNDTNMQFGHFEFVIGGIRNAATSLAEITGLNNTLQLPHLLVIVNENIDAFWAREAGDKILLLKINSNFTGTINPNILYISGFYQGSHLEDTTIERKKYFTFSVENNNQLLTTFGNDIIVKNTGLWKVDTEKITNLEVQGGGTLSFGKNTTLTSTALTFTGITTNKSIIGFDFMNVLANDSLGIIAGFSTDISINMNNIAFKTLNFDTTVYIAGDEFTLLSNTTSGTFTNIPTSDVLISDTTISNVQHVFKLGINTPNTQTIKGTLKYDVTIKKGGNLDLGTAYNVFNNLKFDGCSTGDLLCLSSLYAYISNNDYFSNTSQTATLTIKEDSKLKLLDSLDFVGLSAFNFDFNGVTGATTFLNYQGNDIVFSNISVNIPLFGNFTLPQTIITFKNIGNSLVEGTEFTLIKVVRNDGLNGDLTGIQFALDFYNNMKKKVSNNETLSPNVILSRRMYLKLDDSDVSGDFNRLMGTLLIDVAINGGGELLFDATNRNGAQYTTLKVDNGGTLTLGSGADFKITGLFSSGYTGGTPADIPLNFINGAKLKFDMSNYTTGIFATFATSDNIDLADFSILATGYSNAIFKNTFNNNVGQEFTLISGTFLGNSVLKNTIRIYFNDCGSDCPTSDPYIEYKKGLQLIGDDVIFADLKGKFISDVWVKNNGNLIFDNTLLSNFSNITIENGGKITIKKESEFYFDKIIANGSSEIIFDLTSFSPNAKGSGSYHTGDALLKTKNDFFQIADDPAIVDDYTGDNDIIDISHIKIKSDPSYNYNEGDAFLLIDFMDRSSSLEILNLGNSFISISSGLIDDDLSGVYGCIVQTGSDKCISMNSGFNLSRESRPVSTSSARSLVASYTNATIIEDGGFFKIIGERRFALLQIGSNAHVSGNTGAKLIFTKDSSLVICESGSSNPLCTNGTRTGLIIQEDSIFDFDFENIVSGDTFGTIKQKYEQGGLIIDLTNVTFSGTLKVDTSGIGGTTDYNIGETFYLLEHVENPDGNFNVFFSNLLQTELYFSNGISTTDTTTNLDEAKVTYMKGLFLELNDDITGKYILDARIEDEGNLTIDSIKRFSTLYVGDNNSGGQENAKLTFKNGGALSVDGILGNSSGLIFEEGSQLLFDFSGYTSSFASPSILATIDDTSGVAVNFYNVRDKVKLTKGSGVLTSGDQIILLQGLNSTSFINEDNVFNPYDFNGGNPLHFTDEDDDITDNIDRFRFLDNFKIDGKDLVGDYFYDATVKDGGEIIFGDTITNRETEQNIQNLKINEGGTLTFGKNLSTTALTVVMLEFNADTFGAPTNASILNFDLSGWDGTSSLAYIDNFTSIDLTNLEFSASLNGSTYNIDDELTLLQSITAGFNGTVASNTTYFEDGTTPINNIEYKRGIGLEISSDGTKIIGKYKYGATILDDGIMEIPAIVDTKYSFLKVGDNATHISGKFATLSFFKNSKLIIGDVVNDSFALNDGAHLNFNLYESKNLAAGDPCGTNAIGDTCQNASAANNTIGVIQSAGTTSTISLAGVKFTASIGTDNTTTTGTVDYNVGDTFKLLTLTSTDKFDSLTTSQIFFGNGIEINFVKYKKGLDLSLVDSDKTIEGKYRYDVEVLKTGTLSISGSNNIFSKLLVGEGGVGGVATLKFVNGAIMDVKENITFRDDTEFVFDFAGYVSGNTLITYTGAGLNFNPLTTDVVTLTGYADSFFTPGTTMTLINAASITDGFNNNVGKVYFDDFTSSLGANIDENKGLKIEVAGNELQGVFIHDVIVNNGGELLIDMNREYTALKVETGGLIKFKMASPSSSQSTILKLETFEIENNGKLDFDFAGVLANMTAPLIELEINHDLDLTNTDISLSNADLVNTYNAGDRFVLLKLDNTNQKGISFNQQPITFTGITQPPNVDLEIGLNIDREHTAGSGDSLVGKFIKNITIKDDGIYTINATEKFSNLVIGDTDTAGNENAILSFKKDSDLTIFDTITLNSGSFFHFDFDNVSAGNTIGKIEISNAYSSLDLINTGLKVDIGNGIYNFGDTIILLESNKEISHVDNQQIYSPASWSEDDDVGLNTDQNINVEYKKGFDIALSSNKLKIEGKYRYSVVVHGKDKGGIDGAGSLRIDNQVSFSSLNIGESGETASATLILANGAKINTSGNLLNAFIFAQNAKLDFDLSGYVSGSSLAEIYSIGTVDLTNLVSADFSIRNANLANLVVGQDITLMKIMSSGSFINMSNIQSINISDGTTNYIYKRKYLDVAFNSGGTTLSGIYTYNADIKNNGNMIFGNGATELDTQSDYTFSNIVVENGGKLTLADMTGNFATTSIQKILKTNSLNLQSGGTLFLQENSKFNVGSAILNGIVEFDFSGVVAGDTISTFDTGENINLGTATIKLTNFDPSSFVVGVNTKLIEINTSGKSFSFTERRSYFDSTYAGNSDAAGVKVANGLKLTTATGTAGANSVLVGVGVKDLYVRNYDGATINGIKEFATTEAYSTIYVGFKSDATDTSIEKGKVIFKNGADLTFDDFRINTDSIIEFDFTGISTGGTIANITTATAINLAGADLKTINLTNANAGASFTLLNSNSQITLGSPRFVTTNQTDIPEVAVDIQDVLEISLDSTFKKIMGTYTKAVVIHKTGVLTIGSTANPNFSTTNLKVGDTNAPTTAGTGDANYGTLLFKNGGNLIVTSIEFTSGISKLAFDLTGHTIIANPLAVIDNTNLINLGTLSEIEITQGSGNNFDINDEIILLSTNNLVTYTRPAQISFIDAGNNILGADDILRNKYLYDIKIDSNKLIGKYGYDVEVKSAGNLIFGSAGSETDTQFSKITIENGGILTLSNQGVANIELVIDQNLTFQSGAELEFNFATSYDSTNSLIKIDDNTNIDISTPSNIFLSGYSNSTWVRNGIITLIEMTGSGNITGISSPKSVYFNGVGTITSLIEDKYGLLLYQDAGDLMGKFIHDINILSGGELIVANVIDPYNNVNVKTGGKIIFKNGDVLESEKVNFELNSMLDFDLSNLATGTLAELKTDSPDPINLSSIRNNITINKGTNSTFKVRDILNLLEIDGTADFSSYTGDANIYFDDFGGVSGLNDSEIYRYKFLQVALSSDKKKLKGEYVYNIEVKDTGRILFSANVSDAGREEELEISSIKVENGGTLTLKEQAVINTATNKLQTLIFENGSHLEFDFSNINVLNAIGTIHTNGNLTLHNDTIIFSNLTSSSYDVGETFKLLEISTGNSISGFTNRVDFADEVSGGYTIKSALLLDFLAGSNNVLLGKYTKDLIVDNNSIYEVVPNDKYNSIKVADATTGGTLTLKTNNTLEAIDSIVFNSDSVLNVENNSMLKTPTITFSAGTKINFDLLGSTNTTELLKLNANSSNGIIDLSNVVFDELTNFTSFGFSSGAQIKLLQLVSGTATKIELGITKKIIYFDPTILSTNVYETSLFELSVDDSSTYHALIGEYKEGVRVKNAGNFLIDQTYPTNYDIVSVEDGGTLTFANDGILSTTSIVFADNSTLAFDLDALTDADLVLAEITNNTQDIKLSDLGDNINIAKNNGSFSAGKTIDLLTADNLKPYNKSEIIFTDTNSEDTDNVDRKRYLSEVKVNGNTLSGTYKYDITINSGNDELRFGGIGGEAETTITTLTAKNGGILTFGTGADITIEKMTFETGSIINFDFAGYTTGDFATINNDNSFSLNKATITLTGYNNSFFTKDNIITLISKGTGQGMTGYNTSRTYFDDDPNKDDDIGINTFAYKGLEIKNDGNDGLQATYIRDLFVKSGGQYELDNTSAEYNNTYIKSGGKMIFANGGDLLTDNLIFETGSMLHFDLSGLNAGDLDLADITNTSEIKLNNLTAGAITIDKGTANIVVGDTINLLTAANISGYQPVNRKIMFNDSTDFEKGFLKDIAINSNVLSGEVGLALVVENGQEFDVSNTYTKTFNYVSIENGGKITFDAVSDSTITIQDTDNFVNNGIMELKSDAFLKLNGAGGKLINNGIIVIGERDAFITAKLDVADISLTSGELHFLIDKNYNTTILDPLLFITSATDINLTNTEIKLFSQTGSANLDVGKQIKLMQTDKIFAGTPNFEKEGVVEIHAGFTKIYYADLSKGNNNKDLYATITEKTLAEETKTLNESAISSSLALINTLSFVETAVVRDVIYNSNSASNSGLPNQNLGTLFASNVGYSKTITGSYVESMSGNVVAGFDAYNALIRNLNIAAFIEASSTNFTTHNDFSRGVMELKGTNTSFGAGGLGIYRHEFNTGNALSFEASIHTGFVMTELVDDLHAEFDYNLTSAYFAGHTGLTYSYYTGGNTYIDFYGKLLLMNNFGGEAEIKTTDTLKVKPFAAKRIKTGVNFNGNFNEDTNYYVGGGIMYDLEAKQESTLDNLNVESTSIAGSSIMFSGGINGSFTYNFKYNAGVELTSGKTTSANVTLGIKYIFDEETENSYKYNRRPSFSGDGYGSGGKSDGYKNDEYEDYGTMNKVDTKKKKAEEYKKQYEEELKRKDTSAGIVKGQNNKNKGRRKRKDDDDSIIRVERLVELEEEDRIERQNGY